MTSLDAPRETGAAPSIGGTEKTLGGSATDLERARRLLAYVDSEPEHDEAACFVARLGAMERDALKRVGEAAAGAVLPTADLSRPRWGARRRKLVRAYARLRRGFDDEVAKLRTADDATIATLLPGCSANDVAMCRARQWHPIDFWAERVINGLVAAKDAVVETPLVEALGDKSVRTRWALGNGAGSRDADTFQRIAVKQYQASRAAGAGPEKFEHSIDFTSVCWRGCPYRFSKKQAVIVGILWREWKKRTPTIKEETIALEIDPASKRLKRFRVWDYFKGKKKGRDGKWRTTKHPAWGTMIVVEDGIARLNEKGISPQ